MKALRTSFRRHGGFTLIELLVVIVIIIVLMGIALQVAKTANERTKRAQTVTTMQALRNALAGYYAAYGQYPPSSGTGGTYPSSNVLLRLSGATPAEQQGLPSDQFGHGLLYYLMAFKGPDVSFSVAGPAWYPKSVERATAERWRHYLETGKDANGNPTYVAGIHIDELHTNLSLTFSSGSGPATNTRFAVSDGWGSNICYEAASPDYQSFRLWSVNMTNGWEE